MIVLDYESFLSGVVMIKIICSTLVLFYAFMLSSIVFLHKNIRLDY